MSKIMALVLCGGAAALSMLSPFSMLRHSQLALADRRVLVTAPRIDAGPLAAALIEAGAHPLWRPTVRIAPLAEDAVGELDECIMRLSDYDVLLLSNRHALDAVVARGTALADGDSEVFRLMLRASAAEIAATGPLSTRVQATLGTPATVVPFDSTPEGMATALSQLRPEAAVLVPAPTARSPELDALTAALEQSGASVTRTAAYELLEDVPSTSGAGGGQPCVELGLLPAGQVDAICVGSAAEVRGLSNALVVAGFADVALPLVVAVGQEAADAAESAGLQIGVVVDERGGLGPDAVVAALSAHFGAGRLLF